MRNHWTGDHATAFRRAVLILTTSVLGFAASATASPIMGTLTGLASPTSTVTFDELGDLQGQVITSEFAAYGVTFSNFGWDNGSTFGQTAAIGFAGADLIHSAPGFPITSPPVIRFNSPVTEAAFAALDQDFLWTVESYLGGNLVESFQIVIPVLPGGSGFIGFENSLFDEIRLSTNEQFGGFQPLSIDTLQFSSADVPMVPEPGAAGLFAVGLLVLGSSLRRRSTISPV